jgi:hypothetical protein
MGRMHEASLLAGYKMWTMDLLSDMDSAAPMLIKGKVPILPKLVRDRKHIQQIFERSRGKE